MTFESIGNHPLERQEIKQGFFSVFNIDTGSIVTQPLSQDLITSLKSGESSLLNKTDWEEVARIEKEKFTKAGLPNVVEDLDSILTGLFNRSGIQIIFRDHNKVRGYLSSIPADQAKEEFKESEIQDSGFDGNKNYLYIESLAATIGSKNYTAFMELLKSKAQDAGYQKIVLHSVNQLFTKIWQQNGFAITRHLDEWFGGYPADFLEYNLMKGESK